MELYLTSVHLDRDSWQPPSNIILGMGFIFTTARTEEVQLVCMSSENHQTNDTYHFSMAIDSSSGWKTENKSACARRVQRQHRTDE